ncbi:MAG: hypothetical protein KC478_17050 [Bacteriovoracaceae bacterium]|nr:hypothetical protein [Bacteriovoracaceae bacterium]
MRIIILTLFMVSCGAIKYKKDKVADKPVVKTQAKVKAKTPKRLANWADNYYAHTVIKVEGPIVNETPEQILKVCQGIDLRSARGYGNSEISKIEFKKRTLTFKTKDGFVAKAHVTRGVCRELALFQAKTKDKNSGFRKKIKFVSIEYIYNGPSFVTELVFDSNYKGVSFTVK